jgi:ankyrin repeat protein
LKLTQELLRKERCFDVNFPDASGRRALHIACIEEHAEVALELLFAGANIDSEDSMGETALHKVVQGSSLETMQVIVEQGNPTLSRADHHLTTPLLLAASLGKIQFVEYLLAKDERLASASNENGWTALHLCAHGREMRRNSTRPGKFNTCAKLLLDAKAEVDAFDEDRKTALHRAAQTGGWETCTVLIQGGAAVTAADYCRWTPLHYAAQDGHLEVAKVLLNAKAVVQDPFPTCLTPLAVATMENQVKMAELLIKNGADQQLRGKGLASPIMIARKDPNKFNEILALFELGFINHES